LLAGIGCSSLRISSVSGQNDFVVRRHLCTFSLGYELIEAVDCAVNAASSERKEQSAAILNSLTHTNGVFEVSLRILQDKECVEISQSVFFLLSEEHVDQNLCAPN
jgi:hypothetical protein